MWYITLYYIVIINRLPSVISIVFKFRPVVPMTSLQKSNIISFHRSASPEQNQYHFDKPECGPVPFPGISCEEKTTCGSAEVPLRMSGLHENLNAVCHPNKVMRMEQVETKFRNSAFESLHRGPVKPNLFLSAESPRNVLQSRAQHSTAQHFETIGEPSVTYHNRNPVLFVAGSTENKNYQNLFPNNLWFRNRPSLNVIQTKSVLTSSSHGSAFTSNNGQFRPGFLSHQNPRLVQFPNIAPKPYMYPRISPLVSETQTTHISLSPSLPDYQTRSHREDPRYMKTPDNIQNQSDPQNFLFHPARLPSYQFPSRLPPNIQVNSGIHADLRFKNHYFSTYRNKYQTTKGNFRSPNRDYVQPESTVRYVNIYNTYKTMPFPRKAPNIYASQQDQQLNRESRGENDYHSGLPLGKSTRKRTFRYNFNTETSLHSVSSELMNFRGHDIEKPVEDFKKRIKRHRRVKINRIAVTTSTMPPFPDGRTPALSTYDPLQVKCMHVANCVAFNWKEEGLRQQNPDTTAKDTHKFK